MDVWISVATFASGVIAAFSGFLLQESVKNWQLRKSVANALLAEINASKDHYMRIIGDHINQIPENQLPSARLAMRDQNPFPIFDHLSQHLGIFPQDEAGRLARLYTEASGFVHSVRSFMARMNRIDELAIAIHSAESIGDVPRSQALRTEHQILLNSQLAFFAYIRSTQQRTTEVIYQDVTSLLKKYSE